MSMRIRELAVQAVPGTIRVTTTLKYGILAMPTLVVFRDGRDGEVAWQAVGARPKRRLLADLDAIL